MVLESVHPRGQRAAGARAVLVALAVALSPSSRAVHHRRPPAPAPGHGGLGDVGLFSRPPRRSTRSPGSSSSSAVQVCLVVLAVPALRMQLTSSGPELLPKGTPSASSTRTSARGAPPAPEPRSSCVSRAPAAEVEAWAGTVADRPGVESVDPVATLENGVTTVGFQSGRRGTGEASRSLVDSLAHRPAAVPDVGRRTGLGISTSAATVADRALWAVGLVVLATLVLLFLMTGSVVIPVKALIMNVLSLGAALGVLVLDLPGRPPRGPRCGFTSTGGDRDQIPLLVLAFGFGLSMDYEVFLLSRISRAARAGPRQRPPWRLGLQRSGRIITSAALLMVIVFAGFAAGQLLVMKEIGVALVTRRRHRRHARPDAARPGDDVGARPVNWWAPPAAAPPPRALGHHGVSRVRRLSTRSSRRGHRRSSCGRARRRAGFRGRPTPSGRPGSTVASPGAPTTASRVRGAGSATGLATLWTTRRCAPGSPARESGTSASPAARSASLPAPRAGTRSGDGDWLWTRDAPPAVAGEEHVRPLDPARREDVVPLPRHHSPRTHGQPFARPTSTGSACTGPRASRRRRLQRAERGRHPQARRHRGRHRPAGRGLGGGGHRAPDPARRRATGACASGCSPTTAPPPALPPPGLPHRHGVDEPRWFG